MSTPLNTVKERFESKEKLVAAVEKLMTEDLWVPRLSSDRGGNKGVSQISNAKLLRLHDALSSAKEQFGTRAKLIDAILELDKRDQGRRLPHAPRGLPGPPIARSAPEQRAPRQEVREGLRPRSLDGETSPPAVRTGMMDPVRWRRSAKTPARSSRPPNAAR